MAFTSDRVRFSIAAFRAACFAVICLASSAKALAQSADISGRIDVRNVEAAALLYAVAEAVNINLVAPAPKGTQIVSISTEYSSVDDLLQKLAKQVGMRGVVLGDRIFVLSPCLHSQAINTPPQAPGNMSFRIPDATLELVLQLSSPELLRDGNRGDAAMLSRRLLLRMIAVSPDDVLQSVSAALGREIAPASLANLIDRPAGVGDCPGVEGAPLSGQQEQSRALRHRQSHCPYRAGLGNRPCEPLEFFSLKKLSPRGFIEIEGLQRRYAFVEAPDGVLYVVKRGAYMGHDFGKVVEVSRNGIQLIEIIKDSNGGWTESKVELRHWIDPDPSQVAPRSGDLTGSPTF